MILEIMDTADGSHTVRNKELGVTYHSTHGALHESMHVFIDAGLRYVSELFQEISIVEVGFGTGLNTLLTYNESLKRDIAIHYRAAEKFPVEKEIVDLLNYADTDPGNVFHSLHELDWNTVHRISDSFRFEKIEVDIREYKPDGQIHLVYYDAFAPGTSPEMWEEEIFKRIYQAMVPGGCLVTFCAKGSIKRLLKTCGFKVEALVGPPGKREMTRAIKT